MRITNGSVTYSRVVKDADYGVNRKAEFTLSFTLDEDEQTSEEELLNMAGKIAQRHVVTMLDLPAPVIARPAPKPVPMVAPSDVPAATPPGDEGGEKRKPGRPTKPRLTPPVEPTPLEKASSDAPAKPDVWVGKKHEPVVEQPAVDVITDATLQAKCSELAPIKGGSVIREFAAKKAWWKSTVRDCPMAERTAFIAELEALPSKE